MKTNKTIKQMVLAASVALTMGVASAQTIPGLPGDTFEFNQIGNAPVDISIGTGGGAIAQVNDILGLVGNTGGSQLNTDNFWKSFVKVSKEQTFDYVAAKPMIEELVFTVTGEAYGTLNGGGSGWADADDVEFNTWDFSGQTPTLISTENAKTVMLSRTSQRTAVYTQDEVTETAGFAVGDVKIAAVLYTAQDVIDDSSNTVVEGAVKTAEVTYTQAEQTAAAGFTAGSTRTVSDGKLLASGEAAVHLLTRIGFTNTSGVLGSHNVTGSTVAGEENLQNISLIFDPANIGNPVNTDDAKDLLVQTVLAAAGVAPEDTEANTAGVTYANTFADDAAAAHVNAVAFANANHLITLISQQLKNSYLLDTTKATAAIDGVIEHHNNYLSASLIDQAKSLKGMIKNVGLQTAAVTIGKTAGNANVCGAGGANTTDGACVKIGEAFKDISQDITDLNVSTVGYNNAVDAIEVFAQNLTDFNISSVTTFVSSDAKTAIDSQFGDIMVKNPSNLNTSLDGGSNPFNGASWNTAAAFSIVDDKDTADTTDDEFEFNSVFSIEGLDVDFN